MKAKRKKKRRRTRYPNLEAMRATLDAFRMATEDLGEELYRRASYRDIWLNLVPKERIVRHRQVPGAISKYAKGYEQIKWGWSPETGLTQSTFTVGRSEPINDESDWCPRVQIQ